MTDPEKNYRIAEAALEQAVQLDLEAEVAFVTTPNPTTETRYRTARQNLLTSALALNERQHARLFSAATLAQFAKAIMDELQSDMEIIKASSASNHQLLLDVLARLDQSQAVEA